jgi:hypothetical protein
MGTKPMTTIEDPGGEQVDEQLKVTPPKQWATGVPAVTHAIQYSLEENSIRRTAINLFSINQANGVDCPGCAWPEPRTREAAHAGVLRERRQAHQR